MKYKTYKVSVPSLAYEKFYYPAGEMQVRFHPEQLKRIAKADLLDVTATIKNADAIMELALVTDALKSSVKGLRKPPTLKLDYLPYGRADRRFVDGDCFGLKVFGQIISGLGYLTVETIDVHSLVAAEYLPIKNIDPLPFIKKAIRIIGKKDLTILLPDKGAARYNLKSLKLPIVQADKIRDPQTGKLSGFQVPQIKTAKVLIVDDICDGGGTFIGIADALDRLVVENELLGENALPLLKKYLYTTHGIYSKGLDELRKRFQKLFTYKGEVL
jgi:ribose-phosphate pyrophosphokinase